MYQFDIITIKYYKKMDNSIQEKFARDNFVYLEAKKGVQHTHTLIFLHGLGDTAKNFSHLFGKRGIVKPPGMKIILPNAPK